MAANYFDVLGVKPLLGRTFRAGEDVAGAEPLLLLSYDYWMRLEVWVMKADGSSGR